MMSQCRSCICKLVGCSVPRRHFIDPERIHLMGLSNGGKGVWGGGGRSLMPAFLNLSKEEIRLLVDWILAMKETPPT